MSSYHGWTHRPKAQGGTDPIPVVTSSLFPVNHYFAGVGLTGDQQSANWDMVQDAAAPGGLYRISPGNPEEEAAPVDHLAFPLMLNSPVNFGQWQFRWNVERGPDCGKYRVEIASAFVGGIGLAPWMGYPGPSVGTCLTWLQIYPSSVGSTAQDLYAATSSWAAATTSMDIESTWCPMLYYRLTGAAGDVADDVDYLAENLGGNQINGGPGMYWLRFVPTGTKNASSSDYLLRLAALSVMLMPQTMDNGDGFEWCGF